MSLKLHLKLPRLIFLLMAISSCASRWPKQTISDEKSSIFRNESDTYRAYSGKEYSLKKYKSTPDILELLRAIIKEYYDVGGNQDWERIKNIDKKDLLDEEALALYSYTTSGYFSLTEWISDGSPKLRLYDGLNGIQMEAMFLGAVSALNNLKPHVGPVYFGAPWPKKRFKDDFKIGSVWFREFFTSTSVDQSTAVEFGKAHDPEEQNCLFIVKRSSQGRDIKLYSAKPKEDEVLFIPSQKFRILSIKYEKIEDNLFSIIDLEEVD